MKKVILVSLIVVLLLVSSVSAGFIDWITGKTIESPLPCTDSDGGKDYFTKGIADNRVSGVGSYYEDRCLSKDLIGPSSWQYNTVYECIGENCTLQEGYCEGNAVTNIAYYCKYGCRDGTCISAEKTTPTFTIAVEDAAPASDVMLATHVINSLKEAGYEIPVGVTRLFSEVNAAMLDGKVTLAIYNNEAVIIIGATSPAEHVIFGVEIAQILKYKGITSKQIVSTEVPSADLIDLFKAPEQAKCTDSDGGKDYYKKGLTKGTFYGTDEYTENYDYCIVNEGSPYYGYLTENFCKDGFVYDYPPYKCPNGCKYGACLKETQITYECKDSDGGNNIYEAGTIKGLHYGEPQSFFDYCFTSSILNEYYCDGSNIAGKQITCPEGYKCVNKEYGKYGACVKAPVEPTKPEIPTEEPTELVKCADSDRGLNYYVRGSVKYYEDNMYSTFTDKCRYTSIDPSSKTLEEGYCEGNVFRIKLFECPQACSNGACVREVAEVEPEPAYETVTCYFVNSDKEQKCYSADSGGLRFTCTGTRSCSVKVKGKKGEKITWKSSCGGYDYNIIDGQDNNVDFDCIPSAEVEIGDIKERGFKLVYWECYDGTEDKEASYCKTAAAWKREAERACRGHCYADGSKCGVNSFSVSKECYLDEVEEPSGFKEVPQPPIKPEAPEEEEAEETEEVEESEDLLVCKDSCPLNGKCYPFGYRKGGRYCSDSGAFESQLEGNSACDNNFECKSNICVDSNCVSSGLLRKVMNWFKRMFGG